MLHNAPKKCAMMLYGKISNTKEIEIIKKIEKVSTAFTISWRRTIFLDQKKEHQKRPDRAARILKAATYRERTACHINASTVCN